MSDTPQSPAPSIFSASAEPAETTDSAELTLMKQRARMMGVSFSNNIGIEKLRERMAEKQNKDEQTESRAESEQEEPSQVLVAPTKQPAKAPSPHDFRQNLRSEALKLIRVRITCLDPKKKALDGEIITVANKYIGTVRKFVPFGEATEDGYHIEHVLYETLRDRKFLQMRTVKINGQEVVKTTDEREFAIEVLPPLTEKELQRLALKQAASKGEVEAD